MRFLILLLVSFSVSFSSYANEIYSQSLIPDWVRHVDSPIESSYNDHEDGKAYLLVDKQFNLTADQAHRFVHYATQAVTTAGLESISQVSIDFDPSYESILFHQMAVIRDGVRIDKSKDVELKRLKREVDLDSLLYNGDETYYLILSNMRVGDILEYSYSRIGSNPVFAGRVDIDISAGWSVPVLRTNIDIITPVDSDIRINIQGDPTAHQVETTEADNTSRFHFSQGRSLYDYDEDNQPSWYMPYPHIRVSGYQNWQDVVDWALPLYQADATGPLVSEAIARIKAKGSKEAQIIKAIQIAQEEIRYLGIENSIGSHAPRKPEQILEQGYGDCKDKALLLSSFLQAIGVDASPALVSSYDRHTLPEKIAGPSVFNHVIVRIVYEGKHYWVDATSRLQAERLTTLAPADFGYALVISAQSDGLSDMQAAYENKIEAEVELFVHIEQSSSMSVHTRYFGQRAERLRRYITGNSIKKITEEYEEYYTHFYPGIYAKENVEIEDDRRNNVLTLRELYIIDDLWLEPQESDQGSLKAEVSGDIVHSMVTIPGKKRRKTPYNIGSKIEVMQHIRIHTPHEISLVNHEETISSDEFDYRVAKYSNDASIDAGESQESKDFNLDYYYQQKVNTVPVDRFKVYLKNVNKVDTNFTHILTIDPKNE